MIKLNIKRQIAKLYALDFLNAFNLTDSVWILLLISRGFTLWQAGLAEGVFHLVSFICEIPSGMLADIYGRKMVLVASWLTFALASVLMLFSSSVFGVCLAFGLNAFGYNLTSGTREALTYDSLLQEGQADKYINVCTWQSFIYHGASSTAKLMAGIATRLGYIFCYALHFCTYFIGAGVALTLTEAAPCEISEPKAAFSFREVPHRLAEKARQAAGFIKAQPISLAYMISTAGLSGIITLVGFFCSSILWKKVQAARLFWAPCCLA